MPLWIYSAIKWCHQLALTGKYIIHLRTASSTANRGIRAVLPKSRKWQRYRAVTKIISSWYNIASHERRTTCHLTPNMIRTSFVVRANVNSQLYWIPRYVHFARKPLKFGAERLRRHVHRTRSHTWSDPRYQSGILYLNISLGIKDALYWSSFRHRLLSMFAVISSPGKSASFHFFATSGLWRLELDIISCQLDSQVFQPFFFLQPRSSAVC